MAALTEDDIYRTSTQYRLWSFTPATLSTLRTTAHDAASSRLSSALQTLSASNNPDTNSPSLPEDVSTILPTQQNTLALLTHATSLLLRAGHALHLPTAVRATAVQFLKRFYVAQSVVLRHPRTIVPLCLFLATKTEPWYIALGDFVSLYNKWMEREKPWDSKEQENEGKATGLVTEEHILSNEFVLAQGLRFAFDVRHPFRALQGGLLELVAVAQGHGLPVPSSSTSSVESGNAEDLQRQLLAVPSSSRKEAPTHDVTAKEAERRILTTGDNVRALLGNAAQLSDAYLLYTPAQLWLAALHIEDKPLASWYLGIKFANAPEPLAAKITEVIKTCASLLSDAEAADEIRKVGVGKEAWEIDISDVETKLAECTRLLELAEAEEMRGVKREGGEGLLDEKAAKKRKLEREKLEKDGEVFGGSLESSSMG